MQNNRSDRNCGGGGGGGTFEEIVSLHNLFEAWYEFKCGKKKKKDIQQFSLNLEDNIFRLHKDLINKTWQPDDYTAFYVKDPKLRHIHKASVRDRVLYQAVYRNLYGVFDRHFIHDSYSCRDNKGLHKGVLRLGSFLRKSTQNHRKPAYVLKCDVKKFFDSISHEILLKIILRKISDENTILLITSILDSFSKSLDSGLPLGNVTSQLFANVYLNELDQFVKHGLKAKYYIRYCDDFIIIDSDRNRLEEFVCEINEFLFVNLKMILHPNKISIRKVSQGIDFLGYVVFPHHNVLRTNTKNRILKKLRILIKNDDKEKIEKVLPSYLGLLMHCNGFKIEDKIYDLLAGCYKEIDIIALISKALLNI